MNSKLRINFPVLSLFSTIFLSITLVILSICFIFYLSYIHNNFFAYIIFIIFFISNISLFLWSSTFFVKDIIIYLKYISTNSKILNERKTYSIKIKEKEKMSIILNNEITHSDNSYKYITDWIYGLNFIVSKILDNSDNKIEKEEKDLINNTEINYQNLENDSTVMIPTSEEGTNYFNFFNRKYKLN